MWYIFYCILRRQPTRRALNEAVKNVVLEYSVVGVMEQLGDFYWALEKLMPHYFSGINNVYNKTGKRKAKCMSSKNA
jgi:dermatan/chondrotin sulfate uronyl 2-O-sulfotransferase UST